MNGDDRSDPVWAIADLRRQVTCRFDAELRLTWVDQAYAALYGHHVVGTSFLDLLPAADQQEILRSLRAITPERPRVKTRHRSISADGAVIWQEWTYHGVFDADGNIIEYHGIGRDISEEVVQDERRRRAEDRLQQAAAATGLGTWDFHLRTGQVQVDARALEILGLPGDEWTIPIETWIARIHPDDLADIQRLWAKAVSGARDWDMEYRVRGASDGTWTWIHSIAIDRTDERIFGIFSDVTERRKTGDRLRESERRLQFALQAAREGLWDLDVEARRMDLSEHSTALLGLNEEGPVDGWLGMVHDEDRVSVDTAMEELIDGRTTEYAIEHRIRQEDGRILWVHNRASALERAACGQAVRLVGLLADVTDRRQTMSEFEYLAHHDTLTGLPNRAAFWDAVRRILDEGRPAALVLVDLDHFKPVNDDHGHDFGDRLLIEVAARLRSTVRRSDIVARLGGDEFALLCPDFHGGRDERIVVRVLAALAEPYQIQGRHIGISASAGIASIGPGESSDQLYARADGALYAAKRAGRNRVVTAGGPG